MSKTIALLSVLLLAACNSDDDAVVQPDAALQVDAQVEVDASTFPLGVWNVEVVSPCTASVPMLTRVEFTPPGATLTFASHESIYTEWADLSPMSVSTGGRPLNASIRVESAVWTLSNSGLEATIHYTMMGADVCTIGVLAVLEDHG